MVEIQKIEKDLWYVCTRDEYTGDYPDGDLTFREGFAYKGEDIQKEYSEDEIQKYYLRSFRLWTVQDAKPGDFLTYSSEDNKDWYLIYHSEYVPYENHYHYYACYADKFFTGGTACIDADYLRPSTPKERDLLLQKIEEAGYCWDAENRKLSKTADDEETHRVISDDMKVIPFNIKYRSQVESGEYTVVTREDRPVEIRIWDLKGDFPIVGVYYDEKNNRDTAVQVTAEGRCSINPDDDYCDDFFILTNKSDMEFKQGGWYLCTKTHMFFEKGEIYECHRDGTIEDGCGRSLLDKDCYNIKFFQPIPEMKEVEKELKILIPDWMKNIKEFKKSTLRLLDLAKQDIRKDLPIWKKSEKLIEGALLDRGALYIPRYMIELSELKKLPKEG